MPCVPTLKDPMFVAVWKDTKEMEQIAQVNLYCICI